MIRRLFLVSLALQLISFCTTTPIALAERLQNDPASVLTVQDKFSQEQFLTVTNQDRIAEGEAPLVLNEQLIQAAHHKALDMVAKGYWDHYRPGDHKAWSDFITEAGYRYQVAGENLARGFRTVGGINRAWLQSPSHRANILSSKYQEVGFASLETVDATGQPVLLTVEMFGVR